jgi:hypothetical protein
MDCGYYYTQVIGQQLGCDVVKVDHMDNNMSRRTLDKRQITITVSVAIVSFIGIVGVAWQASAKNSVVDNLDARVTVVEVAVSKSRETQIKMSKDLEYIKRYIERLERRRYTPQRKPRGL